MKQGASATVFHSYHPRPYIATTRSLLPREWGGLPGFGIGTLFRKLKTFGFEFDRQAAGSHEIWFNAETNRYTTVPNASGNMPQGTVRAF